MQIVKGALSFLGGGLFGLGADIFSKKKKPAALPAPVTRDDAAAAVERDDELRRRRGSAADMLTGPRGAEALGGQIGRLVVGS
jgi:hypothetical protein